MISMILSIAAAVVAIALVGFILLQNPKESGFGGSWSGSSESYINKNRSRTREGKLVIGTSILLAVLIVLSVLFNCGFLK